MTATRWWERAACIGYPWQWWFPREDKADRPPSHDARAIAICNGCPVRQECLDDAIKHRDAHSIAGGLTPRQRRPLIDSPMRPEQHGTPGGAMAHRRRGELPCEPCRLAHNRATATWARRAAVARRKQAS